MLQYLMFIMVQVLCTTGYTLASLDYNSLPDELQHLLMELLESIMDFTKLPVTVVLYNRANTSSRYSF